MLKPKYIENILSITKEKRGEIECDVVCECGARHFIGYKEHSIAPYFIEEDQKTVYVNPLQVTIIEETNGKVMLRIEYERRLREVIREKCVTCDHFKGDPDNLDGHYERLRLDGYCWGYENTSEN